MRSPLRLPSAELGQVITKAVEEYMREVNRLRRVALRAAAIDTYQAEGLPVPAEEVLEAHIDVLEALFDAGQDDQEKVLQLIDEMDELPVSMPVSARPNSGQKRKRDRRSKKRPNQ
jgi:hypothetical protein